MIKSYIAGDSEYVLTTDIAGQRPIYLYCPERTEEALYTYSFPELLADSRVVQRPSVFGLSFLLQSGFVPPPWTAYEDIYIISSGDRCTLSRNDAAIQFTFDYQFPFLNTKLPTAYQSKENVTRLLELITQAVADQIDESRETFLFQSAGKDSNVIALALAEAGWQDRVTLITQRSKGTTDESVIAQKIAEKLGFRHRILKEVKQFDGLKQQKIQEFLAKSPLPCLDNVSLAYALYPLELPELEGANLLDGSGNDRYLPRGSSRKDEWGAKRAWFVAGVLPIRKHISSSKFLMSAFGTPAESFGLRGFSYKDSRKLFSDTVPAFPYWYEQSLLRKGWKLADFKGDIRSRNFGAEMYIRKVRNAADAWNSKLSLPLADSRVVDYCLSLPEEQHFGFQHRGNKFFLKELLKEKLDLDSDTLGKLGYTFDSKSVVQENWRWMKEIVLTCSSWNSEVAQALVQRLEKGAFRDKSHEIRLFFRLFLLSGWYNEHF